MLWHISSRCFVSTYKNVIIAIPFWRNDVVDIVETIDKMFHRFAQSHLVEIRTLRTRSRVGIHD